MNKSALVVSIYAALVLIGGLIGFFKAGSPASLIASSTFFVILSACAYGLYKQCCAAWTASITTLIVLFIFFSYRFAATYKWMPAGMMAIVSVIAIILLIQFKQKKCEPEDSCNKNCH